MITTVNEGPDQFRHIDDLGGSFSVIDRGI